MIHSFTLLAGLSLVFLGERAFGEGTVRWTLSGLGLTLVLAEAGARTLSWQKASGATKQAQFSALALSGVVLAGLGLYGVSQAPLGSLPPDIADLWPGIFTVLSTVAVLSGSLPLLLLNRALEAHPVMLPQGTAKRVIRGGLAAAFGIALVFPVNYLAAHHKWEREVAYFKVTEASEPTLSMVKGLTDPVEVFLFYPPGSEVGEKLRPYFDTLEKVSEGRLQLQWVDQAVDPKLAEELKVRDNGFIIFRQGEATEKYKLDNDIDKARRELKKLDAQVQKYLMKIARGPRTAYLMTGHGEASTKEKDNPFRKISGFKGALESLNFKVETFGVADGSSDAVPEDAALLVIAAPETPLLEEEIAAVKAYLDRGGRLMVMVEPGGDRVAPILEKLGVTAGEFPVAHSQAFLPQKRGVADRVLLVSNRFGSHAAVTTLSKNSSLLWVVIPEAVALTEIPGTPVVPSVLVRSAEGAWEDVDGDRVQSPLELGGTFNLGYAASGPVTSAGEGPPTEWRALVFGDVGFMSDMVLVNRDLAGNAQLVRDSLLWVVGDEELAGETNSEEDEKIAHTREQDVKWFYGLILGMPALVFGAGVGIQALRRRK